MVSPFAFTMAFGFARSCPLVTDYLQHSTIVRASSRIRVRVSVVGHGHAVHGLTWTGRAHGVVRAGHTHCRVRDVGLRIGIAVCETDALSTLLRHCHLDVVVVVMRGFVSPAPTRGIIQRAR